MPTQTRQNARPPRGNRTDTVRPETHRRVGDLDLDALSDDEIELLLFGEDEVPKRGPLNLTTVAGLSLIGVGIIYMLQQMGLWAGDISELVAALPWLAGVLIILIGFGVFSMGPRQRRRAEKKARKAAERARAKARKAQQRTAKKYKTKKSSKLMRAEDRMVAGVCGGIADYLGVEATLIRIAFVALAIGTGAWPVIVAYGILAAVLPKSEDVAPSDDDVLEGDAWPKKSTL